MLRMTEDIARAASWDAANASARSHSGPPWTREDANVFWDTFNRLWPDPMEDNPMIAEATKTDKQTTCPKCGADIIRICTRSTVWPTGIEIDVNRYVCFLHPFDHEIPQDDAIGVEAYYLPPFLGNRAPIAKQHKRHCAWEKKHRKDWSIQETIDEDGRAVYRASYAPPSDAPDLACRAKQRLRKANGNGQALAQYRRRYEKTRATLATINSTPPPFKLWLERVKAAESRK